MIRESYVFSLLHVVLPCQEVCDPHAGGVRHMQQGELVLQQSWDDGVKDYLNTSNRFLTTLSCEVVYHVLISMNRNQWNGLHFATTYCRSRKASLPVHW